MPCLTAAAEVVETVDKGLGAELDGRLLRGNGHRSGDDGGRAEGVAAGAGTLIQHGRDHAAISPVQRTGKGRLRRGRWRPGSGRWLRQRRGRGRKRQGRSGGRRGRPWRWRTRRWRRPAWGRPLLNRRRWPAQGRREAQGRRRLRRYCQKRAPPCSLAQRILQAYQDTQCSGTGGISLAEIGSTPSSAAQ